MIDIEETLRSLAVVRPCFHSEADFQHALAWIIHKQHFDLKVRLEYRPPIVGRKVYVDIWLEHNDAICAIELKYKTRRLSITVQGERFDLLNQAAQDVARYDVCKDVNRIEEILGCYPGSVGFAVFLTNDPGYWQRGSYDTTIDAAFRLHDGAVLDGELSWGIRASPGTTAARTKPIGLCRAYPLRWVDYSDTGDASGRFRALVIAAQAL